MSSEHPARGATGQPSDAFVAFSSWAYAATNDDEATRAASEWLEAQAMHPFIRDVSERSLVRLALQPGEAVLEVGCGAGVFLPGLAALVGPSGRVVAAEVHASGATIAHPDPAAARLINAVLVSGIRNVEMGINLRQHFAETGFEDVRGEVVGYFEEELDQDEAEEFTRIARDLAAAGTLDPDRAEAAIAAMEGNRTRGTHCGLALIFVVSGRVPGGSDHGS